MTKAKWGLPALMLFLAPLALAQSPDELAQKRIEQAQPRTAIAFDAVLFDKYVGYYQMPANLRPSTIATVSRDANHFFVKLSRQQSIEILPESSSKFFFKGLPAQISFDVDAQGNVQSLVVHQGGLEISMPRVDEATARSVEATPLPQAKGHPTPRTWKTMLGITPRILTSLVGSIDYWPCFSPDGNTVLFSRSHDGGRTWVLMRVSVSGGETVAFTKEPLSISATRADWSAKNNMVAFTGTASDGSNSVWIVEGDGSGARPVVASGVSKQLFYPSWYPDGQSLAVMDGPASAIKRLGQAGGAAVAVTDPAKVLTGMPSVSPDGRTIAFAGQKNAGQAYNQNENIIWLVSDDGMLSTVESAPIQGRAPVWSPDGKQLAFESDRASPDGNYAVFIINRDGTGLTQVTDYALNATHPVWSRDGRKMVFATGPSGKSSDIAVINLP